MITDCHSVNSKEISFLAKLKSRQVWILMVWQVYFLITLVVIWKKSFLIFIFSSGINAGMMLRMRQASCKQSVIEWFFYHVSYWIVAQQKKAIKQHVGGMDSWLESVNTNHELEKSSRHLFSSSLYFFH